MGGEPGDKGGVGSAAGVSPDPLLDGIIAQLFPPEEPAGSEPDPLQPKTAKQPGAGDKYETSPLAKYMNGKEITKGPFVGLWMDKVDGHGTNKVTSDERMPRFTPGDVAAIGLAFYADSNKDRFDSHKVFVVDGGRGVPEGGEAYIGVNTADKGVNDLAIATLKGRCILTGEGAEDKCEALKETYLRADHTKSFWEEHGGTFLVFGPLITGLGIAISLIAKHLGGRGGGGGNPTGGGGGGEPKLVYDGHQEKWIPNPVHMSLALGLSESTVVVQIPQAAANLVFRLNQAATTIGNTLANPAPVFSRAMAFMESAMPVPQLVPAGAGVGAMPGVTVPKIVPVEVPMTTAPRPVVTSRPAARLSGVGAAGRVLGVAGFGIQFLDFYLTGRDRGVDCDGFLGVLRCIDSGADRFLFGPEEWELTPEQRYNRDWVAGGA